MSISTPCRMCTLPKYLSTLRISTDAICLSAPMLPGGRSVGRPRPVSGAAGMMTPPARQFNPPPAIRIPARGLGRLRHERWLSGAAPVAGLARGRRSCMAPAARASRPADRLPFCPMAAWTSSSATKPGKTGTWVRGQLLDSGPDRSARHVALQHDIGFVGLRLRSGRARQLLNVDAPRLVDAGTVAAAITPQLAKLEQRLADCSLGCRSPAAARA